MIRLPLLFVLPADRLLSVPIEDSVHDGARRCTPKASRPGVLALQLWLVHIGMTKRGAAAQTSFWSRGR